MHILKMATVKLSIQDKKDLDKFTKFLALKAAQIIVQSRLGEKVQTKCKPHSSGTDWVSRAISCVVSSSVSMFCYKTLETTLQYGACTCI
jgi:autophagy-related protein 13